MVDQIPEDRTIRRATDADYPYIGIDTTHLDVGATVQRIKGAIPEVYAGWQGVPKPGGPGFDAETPDGGVLANRLLMGIPYCFSSPLGRAQSPPGTELPQVAGTSLGDWLSFGESRPALPRRPRR